MFALTCMSDRASVNKCFIDRFAEYREAFLEDKADNLHFLYCNAHFLLGLANICESTLREIEKEVVGELGHGLGRDAMDKYKHFRTSGESAAARYVRTAYAFLGPQGDEKSGCKNEWLAYCGIIGKQSSITSFE